MLSLVTFSFPKGGDSVPATNDIDQTITDKLHSIDGFFTENVGQVSNEQVRFYSSGDIQAGFAESAVLVKLEERDHAIPAHEFRDEMRSPQLQQDTLPSARGVMVRITFDGSRKVMPQGVQEMPHRSDYFIGNDPSKWKTGVRSYREIMYRNLYDGIDLSYRTQDGTLKYEFIVRPGADPALITISYEGVEGLRIDRSGEVVVSTALGEMKDGKPITHQDGSEVECFFVKRAPLSSGFGCEGRDPSNPLVIDPLVYSTFLGGNGWDQSFSVAVDSSGSAYVTGGTDSVDFPVTPGAFNTTCDGDTDAFVAKLDATGSNLDYATFLGGGSVDLAWGIAVDSSGSAYVTGETYSTDFPVTAGSFDTTYNGNYDAFVAKLNATGSDLVYATFLGGGSDDSGWEIAVNFSGCAYVTGVTDSADFSVTPGSLDTTYNGDLDAFVAELDSTGSSLVYSTYVGGVGPERGYSIAIDLAGGAYVTGSTQSTNFPVTPVSFDTTYNGNYDAFVAKLNATGNDFDYATFLGSGGADYGFGITVDSSGSAYVTGEASSTDFPVTSGAFDTTFKNGSDAFVAKLNAGGDDLVYSTFLGGGSSELGTGIAIDSSGNAYLTGFTQSKDFPVTPGSFDTTLNPLCWDVFVAELGASGDTLDYATFLGGVDCDYGRGIAVDSSGSVFVTGETQSKNFPVTPGSFDTTFGGTTDNFPDGFVTKLGVGGGANSPPKILSFAASPSSSFEGDKVAFSVTAVDADGDALTYQFDFESDGVFDISGTSNAVSHVYGDDFRGTAKVRVSDGRLFTDAATTIVVDNLPPSIRSGIAANVTGNLTLRVAGEKWHDVNLTIYRDGVPVADASVTRLPGSPDDQAATIENFTIGLLEGNLSAIVRYTPDDDPVNGQPNGANPAWLIFNARDGSESRIHHTFNVHHNDTWIWRVDDLRALLAGLNITFTATAADPGSDDLTFTWDWGDGTPATATTYFNDGIGPDPYPSLGGTFPFTATDVKVHKYATAGSHTLILRVTDDDGGAIETILVIIIF